MFPGFMPKYLFYHTIYSMYLTIPISIRASVFVVLSSIIVFMPQSHAYAQCCTYTIAMQDTYGDGWNGGYLSLYINDVFTANISASGWASSYHFTLCNGDTYRLQYTPQDYENENIYQLYDDNWHWIFGDGPDPHVGEVYSAIGQCGATAIEGSHPCLAFPIDTGQCLTADNTMMPGSGLNPYCADFKGKDVWFVMQSPPSGNINFSTEGGDLTDTGLAVWAARNDCASLQRLGCDDDAGNDTYSNLSLFNLEPHQLLFIQVFGYGGGTGMCSLCVKDLGTVKLDSSELPIITIRTQGQQIPNEPKINALMEIRYNGPGQITHITDAPNVYNGLIGIEVRGASSSGYPQTPYALETRNEIGMDTSVSLLGMPKESDWILLSNYNDRSLVRNTLAQHLFGAMGQYATRQQLCEVMLDSIYKGIYVFSEKIKRDKNRVDIKKADMDAIEGDSLTGGYILQQNYWDPSTSFQSNFSPIDHPEFDIHFVYEYPKPDEITAAQKEYIAAFIDTLETALYSEDFANPDTGYRRYLDTKSFIDYFLINELSRNNDGFKKSVFFHKDRYSEGGKLKAGPAWDFDWAWKNMWGCSIFESINGAGWAHHINDCPTDNYSCGYYIRLLQDSTFNAELRCTYEEYRQTIFDTTYMFAYMDSVENLVQHAQERHFKKWPLLGISGPAPEVLAVATTYPAELDTLKSWIVKRLEWLDLNIPGLCEMSTGTHELRQDTPVMTCSPNPSSGRVTIAVENNTGRDAVLQIYNSTGQTVLSLPVNVGLWKQEIELEGSGLYVGVLRDASGIHCATKIMVQ